MKKAFLIISVVLCSCTSIKQIGSVNMISTRNIESAASYKLIKSYAGSGKSELKKNKAKTVEQAVDAVVRSTPGGEFLKNVKVYVIDSKYYSVEGDVWGVASEITFKGFRAGDRVTWKTHSLANGDKFYTGIIISLKDDKKCLVKEDVGGETREIKYEDLSKSN